MQRCEEKGYDIDFELRSTVKIDCLAFCLHFIIFRLFKQTCLVFHFIDLAWFFFCNLQGHVANLSNRLYILLAYLKQKEDTIIHCFVFRFALFVDYFGSILSTIHCTAFVNLCRPGLIQAKIKGLESWHHSIYWNSNT